MILLKYATIIFVRLYFLVFLFAQSICKFYMLDLFYNGSVIFVSLIFGAL